jgi:hypothetical protein
VSLDKQRCLIGKTLNTPPHRALSGACFSCLLSHVFLPCLLSHRTMQHGSTCSVNKTYRMFQLFCLNLFFSAVAQKRRYLYLPNLEHDTIHWHVSRIRNKCYFFSIQITPTVKKSNPATEPHCSPQGCTVRPRKGAGPSSMGGGGGGRGGYLAFSCW